LAAGSSLTLNLGGGLNKPSTSILVLLAVTVLAVAP
jgi:hypothetical protein